MRERVLGLPPQPGIYMIKNVYNGKCYIGSATKLSNRVNAHRCLLLSGKHQNIILQRSFNKYGANAFIIGVIEFCERDELINRERYFCDLFRPFFNIRKVVESNRGIKLSAETKSKMSKAHSGKPQHENSKAALILSNIKRGGNLSEKTKKALMLGSQSNIGKPKSDKTKLLISQSKFGKKFNKNTRKYESN